LSITDENVSFLKGFPGSRSSMAHQSLISSNMNLSAQWIPSFLSFGAFGAQAFQEGMSRTGAFSLPPDPTASLPPPVRGEDRVIP
jgi:hypothetical protein